MDMVASAAASVVASAAVASAVAPESPIPAPENVFAACVASWNNVFAPDFKAFVNESANGRRQRKR